MKNILALTTILIATVFFSCNPDEDVQPNSGNGGGDSQDNNPEWVKMSGPSDRTIIDVIELSGKLFVACDDAYYLSLDMGENWTEITNLPEFTYEPSSASRRLAVWGDTLFAKINDGNVTTFQKSSDLGLTWSPAFNGLVAPFAETPVFIDGKIFLGVNSPSGEITYRSDDFGSTWSLVDVDAKLTEITTIGTKYISPVFGGFAISEDGGTSFSLSYLEGANFTPSKVAVNQNVAFCGTGGFGLYSVMKSVDEGLTWSPCGISELAMGASEPISEENRILIPANGRAYFSSNLGQSWEFFGSDFPENSGTASIQFRFYKGSAYYFVTVGGGPFYRKAI
jgi:hypothetical protein